MHVVGQIMKIIYYLVLPIISMDMSDNSLGDEEMSNFLRYTPHLTNTEDNFVSVRPEK